MTLERLTKVTKIGISTTLELEAKSAVFTGIITASSFSGDGSGLIGVVGTGSGVVVQEEGSNVGTAQTINFIGSGVTATFSGGIASVEIATSGGGGGGGLSNVVEDTTPQLGGNLDLNSNNITGTGNISITGVSTFAGITTVTGNTLFTKQFNTTGVSTFRSNINVVNGSIRLVTPTDNDVFSISYSPQNDDVSFDFNQTGGTGGSRVQFHLRNNAAFRIKNSTTAGTIAMFTSGGNNELYYNDSKKFETTSTGAIVTGTLVATATTATNVTVTDEASDTECFVMFGVNATGDNAPKSSSSLKYNSSTGGLTAGSFIGDGSGLTGITASGSGVIIRDDGSLVGTAGTIDFGTNVSVSPISAGVVTVTAAAGSIPGISTAQTTELNNLTVAGVATATTFSGSGASLTNLPAANLTGTLPAISGTNLTNLDASDLASGTIPDARFPATLPAISGANLTNLPSDTPADTDVQVTYDVSSNGSSAYRFTGPGYSGADDNPDIYLVRGQRYRFINGTGSGHPFRIQSDTSGTAYTDGVSGSQSGTQDFNVQHDAPARLYYQCTIHSGMIGNIYVVGGSDWRMTDVATNATPEIFTNLNVGIGTDNPVTNFKLDVNGDLSLGEFGGSDNTYIDQKQNGHLNIINSGAQSNSGKVRINKTNSIGGDTTYFRDFEVYDGKDKLLFFVDGSSSRIGVGTDSFNDAAEVMRVQAISSQPNTLFTIKANSTSGQSILNFGDDDFNEGRIIYDHSDNSMQFRTNDAEELRITGIGSVGIGLTNPNSNFHVIASSNHVATFEYSSTSDMAIQLKNSQGSMYFGLGGGEEFMVSTDADLNGSGNNKFSVDSSGRVRAPEQPAALVYKTGTTQSFTADGLVTYDATSYSQGITIANTRSRMTVPVAGKYMINACTSGSVTTANAGDGWKLRILKNGSVYNHTYGFPIETTGSSTGQELAYVLSMVVDASTNDYFEIQIENVGAADADMSYGYFGIYLLG